MPYSVPTKVRFFIPVNKLSDKSCIELFKHSKLFSRLGMQRTQNLQYVINSGGDSLLLGLTELITLRNFIFLIVF